MKYSFMTFSTPGLTLGEVLALAKRLGYDGIEPRIVSKHKHGVEWEADAAARAAIRKQAAESGVALCCIATSCTYADPAKTKQSAEDTIKSIDLAADVGAPTIRVFGGRIATSLTREQAIELVADTLRSVADHARKRGVTVCMETHDDWCNPDHVAAVMKRVDHPAVGVNWDIMHPINRGGATMESAYRTLRSWVRHIHFHDGALREGKLTLVPIGQGNIDHRTAVKLLRDCGYDGYLSGEWINWEPYETHLPRELAVMKRYEQQR
jgi:sugar phosphate isomerase/epimerase